MARAIEKEFVNKAFIHRTIAVPESRQLNVFAELLERRGAKVLRIPLVSILDTPNTAHVSEWLRTFIEKPFDDFILLTGEGLRRLLKFAEKENIRPDFEAALARVRTVSRGPKPGRVLKEIGLKASVLAQQPTTEGIIITLALMDLRQRRIAVQLYGTEPNEKLVQFLRKKEAVVSVVAPYIYASEVDEGKVLKLITEMAEGRVDAIAFTSQPQLRRLQQVAKKYQLEAELLSGLQAVKVAAVGPVVAEQIRGYGVDVDIMPDSSFFMKPLVTAMAAAFQ